ncbi:hypothetical protein MMC19_003934 [Ptychographa xylographoides]|nr:hypothetical protein [Ptychographa xylographoides]
METLESIVLTFNCGRELLKPEVFAQHLIDFQSTRPSPELLIISLQEVAPIAYAFLGGSFLVPYLDRIRQTVQQAASATGDARYINAITRNVGMTVIMAFIQEDQFGRIRWMETGGIGVGVHEMGNKGGVGLRLGYAVGDQTMELTFIAAHLAPMEENLQRRNEDWRNIVSGLIFTPVDIPAGRGATKVKMVGVGDDEDEPLLPGSLDNAASPSSGIYTPTSYLFLAGDLNYRTSARKPTPQDYSLYPQPAKKTDPKHFSNLQVADQLTRELQAGKTAQGMTEAPIYFPPTYKYSDAARETAGKSEESMTEVSHGSNRHLQDPDKEHAWKWAQHRWPSWCDRILYLDTPQWMRSAEPLAAQIRVRNYAALPLMSTSDHRPVALALSIPLVPIRPPDDQVSEGDVRVHPPFAIDPQWREKRAAARRKEIVVGLGAYFALTWEGRGVLLAVLVGALGGWALIVSMLKG